MRVLAFDGGIINLGVCCINDGVILFSMNHSFAPRQNSFTGAQLTGIIAKWVNDNAASLWNLEEVDMVVMESVLRPRIQAIGLIIISCITSWRLAMGLAPIPIVMKSGSSKYTVNPHLNAIALTLKGKKNHGKRKMLSTGFCKQLWPETVGVCAMPDSCDAILLAVSALAAVPKRKTAEIKNWERSGHLVIYTQHMEFSCNFMHK